MNNKILQWNTLHSEFGVIYVPQSSLCSLCLFDDEARYETESFTREASVILIPPGRDLAIRPTGQLSELSVIRFDSNLVSMDFKSLLPEAPTVLYESAPGFLCLFRAILAESQSFGERMTEPLSRGFITALLGAMISRKEINTCTGANRASILAAQAQKIILQEYASELTLQNLADRLFVSPCYLSSVFHIETGMTFRSYLRSVRLQEAKKLLIGTEYLISDIAHQVGFGSAAYLIHAFGDEYGITPNAYRNENSIRPRVTLR